MENLNPTSPHLDSASDLVIVSAFGRGNWMAGEAASRGWKVTLIDVSESLGTFAPEDIEGPFGLLEASDLSLSQKNRLDDEGETHRVPGGVTVWLKNGPLELRGDLTKYLLEKKGIPFEVEEYLRESGLPGKDSARSKRDVQKMPYQDSWLAHWAHQVASMESHENYEAIAHGDHWPVFAPFSVRQVTHAGLQKGLKSLQNQGVKVRSRARVRELQFVGNDLTSIEVQDEKTTVEKGRAFVWMLSSLETRTCPQALCEALFPKGVLEPKWYWARLSFAIGGLPVDQLPLHAIAIEDPFLPWTHANQLVLRKSATSASLNVWLKLPIHFHDQAGRMATLTEEVQGILARRFPGTQVTASDETDPTRVSRMVRQPIYSSDGLESLKTRRSSNTFFCGPEQNEFADWLGAYRPQNQLMAKLTNMKSQWDASDAKQAAREAARAERERAREEKNNEKRNQ